MAEIYRFSDLEFKEIPNRHAQIINRTKILKRRVFFEKVEKETAQSIFANYYGQFMEKELKKIPSSTIKSIWIEKNFQALSKIEVIKQKKQRKQSLFKVLSNSLKQIKSNLTDKIIDITSFENIDFNRPCSREEYVELKKQFDYYVLPESIDEINCEIKTDNYDSIRLNYCYRDEIGNGITKHFIENQSERLPPDYMELFFENVNRFFNTGIKRRVFIEKANNATFPSANRYVKYFEEHKGIYLPDRKSRDEFTKTIEYKQERAEMTADLFRLING